MCYWQASMIGEILNEILTKLLRWIYVNQQRPFFHPRRENFEATLCFLSNQIK